VADPDALDHLSEAVADGVAVDWNRVHARAREPEDRTVIEQLRVIAAISSIHRTADVGLVSPDFTPTEAITLPDDAVRWGPLLILGPLAEGSFGRVYRALDPRLQREVALKVLRASDSPISSPGQVVSEARLLARVRHENVVTVYGADVVNGEVGLWMELINGRRLDALVASDGPFSSDDAAVIGAALCRALAAVHEAGLLHRDIKAQNVMREAGGRVVLMDFGAGRDLQDEAAHPIGTPVYLAPEVFDGKPASIQSDIYSVGVLLFFLTTGRYPAVATSLDGLRDLHDRGAVAQLRDVRPELPDEFVDAVNRALATDPAARYESASAFDQALRRINGADEIVSAEEPTSATRAQRLRTAAIIAAVILAITAGSAWWWTPWSRASAAPPVLAVLAPANPTGDAVAEELGAALASLMSGNLGKLSGVKVVSREATAAYAAVPNDLERLTREVGASYVLDLTVKKTEPAVDVVARMWRGGATVPFWSKGFTGDAVDVQRKLLGETARALENGGISAKPQERAALMNVPTANANAYMAYIEARALLDHAEQSGNVQRAIDLLDGATGIDTHFALAHAALADALRAQSVAQRDAKLLERAARAATTAVQLDPDASEVHTALAAVHYESGKRDDAVTALRRAIDLQPGDAEPHRLLGRILAAQGRVDEGIAQLQAAIRLRPTSFNHYDSLGFVLFTASRYLDAVAAYEKAAEMRPDHAKPYEMLGAIYQMQGDMDRAIGNYEHAIRLGASAAAYANLAFAYFTTGEYDKARTALIVAIERDPKKASLHRDLGDVNLKLNRRADARAAYERSIALSEEGLAVRPHDPFSIVLIALCEANLGRRARAERHASEAMALAPANRDVLFRSAKVFALAGNGTAGLDALHRAVERGYDPEVARRDPELVALTSLPGFERALSAAPAASR
jgi:tetratricopeptide (TPR) repeat protein